MKRLTKALLTVAIALVLLSPRPGRAQILTNGGFESPTTLIVNTTNTLGVWGGDLAAIVTAEKGIVPRSGTNMLKFLGTSPFTNATTLNSSDLGQLVSLDGVSNAVATEVVNLQLSCFLNRIAGSTQNSQFRANIAAFAGSPANYTSTTTNLASVTTSLTTDGFTNSWQQLSVSMSVPTNTTYVKVTLSAVENKVTNAYPQFIGQYADDVTLTTTVTPIGANTPPLGTSATVTTLEDTAYTFTSSNFGFSDPNSTPPNNFLAVVVTTLPSAGTLSDNGTAVTPGQFVPVTDLASGKLKFTPAPNANGNSYTQFTFQVQDDGGTANGGVDTDPLPKTMTITVTAVNDAPGFSLNFGATTLLSENFDGVSADALPSGWTSSATDTGVPWSASSGSSSSFPNSVFVPDSISSANGVFATSSLVSPVITVPAAGARLSFVHSLDLDAPFDGGILEISISGGAFQEIVTAGGSFTSGGYNDNSFYDDSPEWSGTSPGFTAVIANLPPAANGNNVQLRWRLTVDDENDASFSGWYIDDVAVTSGGSTGVTVLEDAGAQTDSSAAINLSAGPPDESGQALQFIVTNDNNALFSVQPALSPTGALTFTPAANINGIATLIVKLQDNGGTANGGIDTSGAQILTITVTPVNHAPNFTPGGSVTILEDSGMYNQPWATSISPGPADESGQTVDFIVTADNLPLFSIQPAISSTGTLTFTPAANANGSTTVTVNLHDNGGTANGGVNLSPPKMFVINVTSVNDAPIGTSKTVSTFEDTAYTFSISDFGFSDPNDSPPNNFLAVKISTLPLAGSLTDNGTAVVSGQFIAIADLSASKLKFTPAANANGANYVNFTFQVQDDGGTANGGVDTDPTPKTITINVTSVNDAPVGTSKTVITFEDTAYTFSISDFGFSDPNDSPPNNFLAVKISALPLAGSLIDKGIAVAPGQFISIADLSAGQLKFTPAANANGANYANFTFQVQDNGGTANGGVDTDPTPKTVTINVTSVNDAPVGTSKTVTTFEDTAYPFTISDFGFSDPNDTPANSFRAVEISTSPLAGTLTDDGIVVAPGQFIPISDLNSGQLKFTPGAHANGANYASFTFQVQDDGGTANGGVDTDPTPRTITINITSPPVLKISLSNSMVTLSWDPQQIGFVLEQSSSLFPPPTWTAVNGVVNNNVTIPLSAGSQFFRLRHP